MTLMTRARLALMLVPLLLPAASLGGCQASRPPTRQPTRQPARPSSRPSAMPASIGVAHMTSDGTIVLQLRAIGPRGAIGESLVRYKRGDPHYEEVKRHLGGLRVGEHKSVPPWPDAK